MVRSSLYLHDIKQAGDIRRSRQLDRLNGKSLVTVAKVWSAVDELHAELHGLSADSLKPTFGGQAQWRSKTFIFVRVKSNCKAEEERTLQTMTSSQRMFSGLERASKTPFSVQYASGCSGYLWEPSTQTYSAKLKHIGTLSQNRKAAWFISSAATWSSETQAI